MCPRCVRVATQPGQTILTCPPTRSLYAILAEREGRAVRPVPRTADYELDLPALERRCDRAGGGAVILAAPNDPTGTTTAPTDIVRLLRQGPLVIVDETYLRVRRAYLRAALIAEFDNLVVVRDCGPWAGLGGLPIGYALTSRALAASLRRAGRLTPPNRAAQLAPAGLAGATVRRCWRACARCATSAGGSIRQVRKLNLLDPCPATPRSCSAPCAAAAPGASPPPWPSRAS